MSLAVRILVLVLSLLRVTPCLPQKIIFPAAFSKTSIAGLLPGDSLIYYQCHVDEASQELTTASGQKISTKAKKVTITEKFVISNRDGVYGLRYYVSGFNEYPNKKFAYLTLKETATWAFEYKQSGVLTPQDVLLLAAFENKTHDIVHYELKINKSCPNEVVIADRKDRRQLIVEGAYLLVRNLSIFRI